MFDYWKFSSNKVHTCHLEHLQSFSYVPCVHKANLTEALPMIQCCNQISGGRSLALEFIEIASIVKDAFANPI